MACDVAPRGTDRLAGEGRLAFYIDLHAHANKRGVFAYGNCHEDGEGRGPCTPGSGAEPRRNLLPVRMPVCRCKGD